MLLDRSGKDLSTDGLLNVSDRNYRSYLINGIKPQKAKTYKILSVLISIVSKNVNNTMSRQNLLNKIYFEMVV